MKNRIFFAIVITLLSGIYRTAWGTSWGASPLKLYYITDDSLKYTSSSALNLFITSPKKFHIVDNTINIRLKTNKIWIISYTSSLPKDGILVVKNSYLDIIRAHFYERNKLFSVKESGDNLSFEHRDLLSNYPNFRIPSKADLICIEIENKGPMKVPVEVLSDKGFTDDLQKNVSLHFLYLGLIVLTLILSFISYFWLKERLFIYYVLSISATGFITLLNFGYAFQYLWPNSPFINEYSTVFYILVVFNYLFIEKLLTIKEHSRWLFNTFRFFYLSHAVVFIFRIFHYSSVIDEAIFAVFCVGPFVPLVAGIHLYKKLDKQTLRFFMLGSITFFASILVYIITMNGLIPVTLLTENSIQVGSAIEIIFFNLAIINKLKIFKLEKEKIIIEQKFFLESEVMSRTLELREKNMLIEIKNKELEEQQEQLEKVVEKRTSQLRKLNKDLNDRNFRLEQFANITAHNLRGPVATLLGLCELFNENPSDPLNQKIIKNVKDSSLKVDGILKDLASLLDHHRNTDAMVEQVGLDKICNEVLELLEKEIRIAAAVVHIDVEQCPFVEGVPSYLKNIFYNLILNSVKYCRKDCLPVLQIKSFKIDDNLYIEFKDNGAGVDLNLYKEKIFQPYQRFHLEIPGKGLGLFITKTQVESMGGKIEIQSEVGEGTTFTIILPVFLPLEYSNEQSLKAESF